jgi:hypothetical protein
LGDFNEDYHHYMSRHEQTLADDGSTDPYSINFEPQTVAERMLRCNKIEDDLMAHNLETDGDLDRD